MRRCVLILLVFAASLGLLSCSQGAPGVAQGAPELFHAVPSDALAAGYFSRLDHCLDRMTDSLSVLRRLDYGKLSRARAAVAMCDVGSVFPLLIVEAGRADADTLESVRSVMALADSLRISSAFVPLESHYTLLLSPSSTVITVARRHIASESSILDAPDFDLAEPLLGQQDVIVLRNRGASRLPGVSFGRFSWKQIAAFLRDAAEWTVLTDQELQPIYPQSQRYFCDFLESVSEAPSKLSAAFPAQASSVIDIPLASLQEWRQQYEKWLDARIELEAYRRRLAALRKSSGKNPLDWEKELGIKELACVTLPGGTLNMVRTSRNGGADGVAANPNTGFVRALYGAVFNPSDSCVLHIGNWLISGDRMLLDSLKLLKERPSGWPAAAKIVVWTPEAHLNWTKESIKIWNSNQ